MVQVSFDTNADSVEELEHAFSLLQQAIARRKGPIQSKMDMPQVEETAVDTPFFKITVKEGAEKQAVPTLNQLINDESLTEDDLGKLFKEQMAQEEELKKSHPEPSKREKTDEYIEIIEYDKEKD